MVRIPMVTLNDKMAKAESRAVAPINTDDRMGVNVTLVTAGVTEVWFTGVVVAEKKCICEKVDV